MRESSESTVLWTWMENEQTEIMKILEWFVGKLIIDLPSAVASMVKALEDS